MKSQDFSNYEIPILEKRKDQIEHRIKRYSLQILLPDDGYGACKSCSCKGWKPNNPKNDYCRECGHHWTQHRDS